MGSTVGRFKRHGRTLARHCLVPPQSEPELPTIANPARAIYKQNPGSHPPPTCRHMLFTPLQISSPPRPTSSSRSNARPAYLPRCSRAEASVRHRQVPGSTAATHSPRPGRPPPVDGDNLHSTLARNPYIPHIHTQTSPQHSSTSNPPVDVQQQEGEAHSLKLELHRIWEGGADHTGCQPARRDRLLRICRLQEGARAAGQGRAEFTLTYLYNYFVQW